MARRYWLMKTEPATFGLEDLRRSPGRTTSWDGVRNYQARNYLRDEVQIGDGVLLYHSSTRQPAIVALAEVVRAGYPDPTQFESSSPYHDPRSDPQVPRWFAVDVRLERALEKPLTRERLRRTPGLEGLLLLRKGMRLSVQPVSARHWRTLLRLAER